MNILHIGYTDRGGAGGAMLRTHQGLLQEGVNSQVLVLNQTKPHISNSHSFFPRNRTLQQKVLHKIKAKRHQRKVHKALKGLPPSNIPFNFPYTPYDLTQHPSYNQADIVTFHWVGGFLDFPSFFTQNTKPVTWRIPDLFPFTGGNHLDTNFPHEAYTDLLKQNLAIKQKALQGSILHLIVLSRWMEGNVKNSPLFKAFPRYLIPNGIDTELFKPLDKQWARSQLKLPQTGKILLFVASVANVKHKGLTYLLEALQQLKEEDVHIAVLGNLKGIPTDIPNLIPIPTIADPKLMAAAYSAADLYVIPSIEDNLPNTAIESVCCGTPVVGFPIGGVQDIVIHKHNGLLCSTIDSTILADTLKEALNFPFVAEKIRKDAVDRYDQAVQANRYIQLYEQLLA